MGVDFETVCKKQQHGRSNDGLAVTTQRYQLREV